MFSALARFGFARLKLTSIASQCGDHSQFPVVIPTTRNDGQSCAQHGSNISVGVTTSPGFAVLGLRDGGVACRVGGGEKGFRRRRRSTRPVTVQDRIRLVSESTHSAGVLSLLSTSIASQSLCQPDIQASPAMAGLSIEPRPCELDNLCELVSCSVFIRTSL